MAEEFKRYIKKQAPFLFSGSQFRVVELIYSSESFGNAIIRLEDEGIRIQFVKDRGQIFLDFRPVSKHQNKHWYSIDLVMQLITGKIQSTSLINPHNIEFVHKNLEKIKDIFSSINLDDSIEKLKNLERERSRRMFPKRKKRNI